MKHLITATGRDFFKAVDELGLSLTQIKALHALDEADEPVSLGRLSDALGLSLAAVSRSVEGLVKRGYVTRKEDPDDRRSKRVLITARGRRIYGKLFDLRIAGLRDFLSELDPDERQALDDALIPIARRLAA
jgi:DNA-binding MarR family transcriptional regulator